LSTDKREWRLDKSDTFSVNNIYGEAREGCPANKRKEWDLMVTAAYWFI
jgi:hypothetical protein